MGRGRRRIQVVLCTSVLVLIRPWFVVLWPRDRPRYVCSDGLVRGPRFQRALPASKHFGDAFVQLDQLAGFDSRDVLASTGGVVPAFNSPLDANEYRDCVPAFSMPAAPRTKAGQGIVRAEDGLRTTNGPRTKNQDPRTYVRRSTARDTTAVRESGPDVSAGGRQAAIRLSRWRPPAEGVPRAVRLLRLESASRSGRWT